MLLWIVPGQLQCVDVMSVGTGPLTQHSSVVSFRSSDVETPSSSVNVNYPWLSLHLHTATPVTAANTQSHTFLIAVLVIVSIPHQALVEAQHLTLLDLHGHFSARLRLNTRTFLKQIFPNCLDSWSNLSISLIPLSFLLHPFGKRRDHVGQVVSVFQGQSWHKQLEEATMIWQIKVTED